MRNDDYYDPTAQADPTPAPAATRKTGPVTDPQDPRLSDPQYASDPDVLNYLNGIYGPGGTATTQPTPTSTWNPQTQAWDPSAAATPAAPPVGGGGGATGSLLAPFGETFTAPTPRPYAAAPTFTPPSYTPPPAFTPDKYTPLAPFTPNTYTPPAAYVPGTYTAPAPFVPDKFAAPTFADAKNDPGYQFAADQGEQQLQQSAAAKGLTNTGGTLKDILAWGQNYAAQRYGDVYNRQFNTYNANEGAAERAYGTNTAEGLNAFNTNEAARSGAYGMNTTTGFNAFNANEGARERAYGVNNASNLDAYTQNEGAKERAYASNYTSQFLDPYKFAYQGALDTFNPAYNAWQTNTALTQRQNENDYANAYNLFNFDYNKFRDQRDSTYNKLNEFTSY